MCSRSLTHAQTIGAVALLAADGRLRHMTPMLIRLIRPIRPAVTSHPELTGSYRQRSVPTGLVKHEKPHRVGAEMRCRDQGLQPTRRAHHHVAPTTQTTRARGAPLAANRFRSPSCWRCRSRASTGIIPRPMGVPVARTARPAMRGRRVRVKSAAVAQRTTAAAGPLGRAL